MCFADLLLFIVEVSVPTFLLYLCDYVLWQVHCCCKDKKRITAGSHFHRELLLPVPLQVTTPLNKIKNASDKTLLLAYLRDKTVFIYDKTSATRSKVNMT